MGPCERIGHTGEGSGQDLKVAHQASAAGEPPAGASACRDEGARGTKKEGHASFAGKRVHKKTRQVLTMKEKDRDLPKVRSLLAPGPARVLCGSGSSPEYESFLSRFCNAHREKGNREHFGDVGMAEIKSLVGNIRERAGRVESHAARTLANELELVMIVARSEEHRRMFEECGGIYAASAAMHTYASFSDIQVNGCKALINMGKGGAAKEQIGRSGALEVIVNAMQEHFECDQVQEKGTWALGVLVATCPENKVLVGEAGGVDSICEAMRMYSGNGQMQQTCLWALGSLAANYPDNAARMGKKGGLVLIVNAMKNFAESASMQEMGCWAMANIAAGNLRCSEYLVKKEGPQCVIQAMKTFPKSTSLQYVGLVALCHFGSDAALEKLMTLPSFALFQ
mmetsp:Transcript_34708/g.85400  ORF Transcript_34708/g.85400 Transcript_34708/m.85400 type:complete len:397 (+) Transcript_34708:26-1216(+)